MTTDNGPETRTTPVHLMLREVWNRGDIALVDELVTDDHVHYDPLVPEPLEGREALKGWVETVREGTPDLTKTVRETYVDDDAVVVTYTTMGTHEGEIMGIAPTGRPFEVDGVYVHHLAEGRIEETLDTWDAFGLFSQIGVFPEVA